MDKLSPESLQEYTNYFTGQKGLTDEAWLVLLRGLLS